MNKRQQIVIQYLHVRLIMTVAGGVRSDNKKWPLPFHGFSFKCNREFTHISAYCSKARHYFTYLHHRRHMIKL